jgi:catecholate siderophore receptor
LKKIRKCKKSAADYRHDTGVKKSVLARAVAHASLSTSALFFPIQPALAQSSMLEEIIVNAIRRDDLSKGASSVSKFTEPLRDIPQSITSLSDEFLAERGVLSLEDALRTVPGITLGAGEFSWQGNNPNLRGFSSRNDMFLDGIRDFGSYSRDPFNLGSVEVLQGPSSIIFGRGSTGGVINQASKKPMLESLTAVNVNLGSDSTLRGSADIARALPALGAETAFRLNVMAHQSEVAGRDGAESRRYGIAPSLALGLGSPTELTLSYMKQVADDTPDYGLPWFDGKPAVVPRSNFYGFDSDFVKTNADIFTAQVTHHLNYTTVLNAQIRYARYSRDVRLTEPLVPASIAAGTSLADITIDRYVFFSDSTENMLFAQASATMRFETGAVDHAVVTGIEMGRESSDPSFGFAIGVPGTNLLSPDQTGGFSAARMETRVTSDTVAKSIAVYAIDTIKLGKHWQFIAGLRWDSFDVDYTATRFAGTPTRFMGVGTNSSESFQQVNKELSYRTALVYKPVEYGTVYFGLGTSFNPSAEGLSFLTTGRGLGLGNQELDPEKNRSYELGTKWELFGENLTVNVAVFRTTKTNSRIPDPDNPGFNMLVGKLQVDGLSLGVSGNLTEKLGLWAGYTYLDGGGPCRPPCVLDAPEHSLSAWATYRLTERLQIGGGGRYISERFAVTAPGEKSIPGYWAFDAMGSYQLTDKTLLKLNLTNLTDKLYFSQLHPWHVPPAPGFTGVFAVNMLF